MCKVSIIIPCYNVDEVLIRRCLNSIDSQTFSDYEAIIVDDGSKPEYQIVFDRIEKEYKRITVFHQANGGVSAARNFGLVQSKGEYILYVDADDYLTPSCLDEAVKIAETENADIVMGMNITTYSTDVMKEQISGSGKVSIYRYDAIRDINKWMLGKVKRQENGSYLWQGPWTRLVRRELVMRTPFIVGMPVGEDIVWNLQLLYKVKKVCIVDDVWYVYYMNPGSATRKYRENAIKESYDSLSEMSKYLDLENDDQYYSYCLRCWSDLKRIYRCYLSYNRKDGKRERKYLFESAPWNVLAGKRFNKLCSLKNKFMVFLYRYHLLFSYYDFMEIVASKKKIENDLKRK